MEIKSILVHVDASPRSAVRLHIAHQLAREHDSAHVTALFAVEPQPVPVAVPAGPVPEVLVPKQVAPEQRARARAIFDAALAEHGPPLVWHEVQGDLPAWGVAQAALYADLLVLGQYDPNHLPTYDVPKDLVESVIVDSGRPALVIPHTGMFDILGRNILVAWKPSRETARAVSGALPLLKRADRVQVVAWGKDSFTPAETTFGIERYLAWHGVEAKAHRYPEPATELGEILLSHAADESADLMVMGCYSHSRLRELVLGGVTRTVLKSMTVPVLMAH